MTCREVEKQWEEWLRGAAPPELEQHLEQCPRCRSQAAELAQTSRWLSLLKQEPPVPGPAFWARLRQRLEESDRGADFWPALGWAASRAALGLAVLVLLVSLGMMREPAVTPVADFDSPQTDADEMGGVTVANGQLDRDQVVVTLVAYRELQP